jgi:hypothetical protein
MPETEKQIDLAELTIPTFPLRYGTEFCYVTLTDHRFTAEIVALRNTPALGTYTNYHYCPVKS